MAFESNEKWYRDYRLVYIDGLWYVSGYKKGYWLLSKCKKAVDKLIEEQFKANGKSDIQDTSGKDDRD